MTTELYVYCRPAGLRWDGVTLFKGMGQIRCSSLVAGYAQTPAAWLSLIGGCLTVCVRINPCLVFGAMLSSIFDGRRMFGIAIGWL